MSESIDDKRKIVTLIENHPGSWIFLGLLVFLISTGALSYEIAGHAIKMEADEGNVGRTILQVIGISILFAGFNSILRKHTNPNFFIGSALIILWSLMVSVCVYSSFFKNETEKDIFKEWTYDWKIDGGRLNVLINPESLQKYYSKKMGMFFVVYTRKERESGDKNNSTNVYISKIIDIPSPGSDNFGVIHINHSKIFPELNLGDDICFNIGVIPKTVNISNCHTINDIKRLNGELLRWEKCPALIDFSNNDSVANWLKSLPADRYEQIKSSI